MLIANKKIRNKRDAILRKKYTTISIALHLRDSPTHILCRPSTTDFQTNRLHFGDFPFTVNALPDRVNLS